MKTLSQPYTDHYIVSIFFMGVKKPLTMINMWGGGGTGKSLIYTFCETGDAALVHEMPCFKFKP